MQIEIKTEPEVAVYVTTPFANGAPHGHGLPCPWILFSRLGFAVGPSDGSCDGEVK